MKILFVVVALEWILAMGAVDTALAAPKPKIYLISPKNRAAISKPQEVTFKFEVDPKNVACTFELKALNHLVVRRPLTLSPTGTYAIKIKIKKAGAYSWRVVSDPIRSERRHLEVK